MVQLTDHAEVGNPPPAIWLPTPTPLVPAPPFTTSYGPCDLQPPCILAFWHFARINPISHSFLLLLSPPPSSAHELYLFFTYFTYLR